VFIMQTAHIGKGISGRAKQYGNKPEQLWHNPQTTPQPHPTRTWKILSGRKAILIALMIFSLLGPSLSRAADKAGTLGGFRDALAEMDRLHITLAVAREGLALQDAAWAKAKQDLSTAQAEVSKIQQTIDWHYSRINVLNQEIASWQRWYANLPWWDQAWGWTTLSWEVGWRGTEIAGHYTAIAAEEAARAVAQTALSAAQLLVQETGKAFEIVRAEVQNLEARFFELHCFVTACTEQKYPFYVYAISGGEGGYIKNALTIKNDPITPEDDSWDIKAWVEANGGKFIEGNWDDLTNNGKGGTLNQKPILGTEWNDFLDQMLWEFLKMPPESQVVLIGHSLGGAAVVRAATEAAATVQARTGQERIIDLLIAVDPVGTLGSRANIVLTPLTPCIPPRLIDGQVNGNLWGIDLGAIIEDVENTYPVCVATTPHRQITQNVLYFYNRWQHAAEQPYDYKEIPGAFALESLVTENDQEPRVYIEGDKDAHGKVFDDSIGDIRRLLEETVGGEGNS